MKPANWFGVILVYIVLTLLCVYLISSDSVLSILRVVLSFVFVAFVPGYCLVNLLFQEGKLDFIERLVLSVALSFSIDGISGLFLGLSPLGLNFASITVTVSGLSLVLAVMAFLRKIGLVRIPSRRLSVKNSQSQVIKTEK